MLHFVVEDGINGFVLTNQDVLRDRIVGTANVQTPPTGVAFDLFLLSNFNPGAGTFRVVLRMYPVQKQEYLVFF